MRHVRTPRKTQPRHHRRNPSRPPHSPATSAHPTLAIETKPDHTPVTRADKESEQILRAYLAQRFPQDTIVGEEFGTQHGTTDYKWYLDPIDGTKSFIRGIPLFGVMMGLEHRDEAVAGVIVFPALNEIVYAAKGLGAWWSDSIDPIVPKQARVTKVSNLSDACLSTTSTRSFHRIGKSTQFQRLSWVVDVNRGLPDCYGHYLVATGRAEIMIDPIMNAWDNAPLQAIIEEAGGRFTDLKNNPTIHGDSAISTTDSSTTKSSRYSTTKHRHDPNAPVVEDATKRAFGARRAVERRTPYQPTRQRRLPHTTAIPPNARIPRPSTRQNPLSRGLSPPLFKGEIQRGSQGEGDRGGQKGRARQITTNETALLTSTIASITIIAYIASPAFRRV